SDVRLDNFRDPLRPSYLMEPQTLREGATTLFDDSDIDEALKILQRCAKHEPLVVTENDNRRMLR
ncbi:hypothetical protein KEM54_002871, partial [Ascosphaera aggregata]